MPKESKKTDIEQVVEGLLILKAYDPGATVTPHGLCCIMVGTPWENAIGVSGEDGAILRALGWEWEGERRLWIWE